ncbi:MAG: hypothetical protein JSU91_01925 [Thermoplasmatales archaeon]|nr:MAG: hypothetical protein JSU91_01925 [Thermoplasmatales archaeon]
MSGIKDIQLKQEEGEDQDSILVIAPALLSLSPESDAAIKELPLKLKNEKRLNRKLRSIFNKIGNDSVKTIRQTGFAPDITNYQNQLSELIQKDSATTMSRFSKQLRKELKLGNIGDAIIKTEIKQYIEQTSFEQAGYIISTTQKRLGQTMEKAFKDFAQQGIEPKSSELAKIVKKDFKKINRTRSNTISANEVQRVSERAKLIEAETLYRLEKIRKPQKRWDAILDNKTRPWHALADAQIVDISSPFIVKGEQLMHPGDKSLGASLDNIINCRCSVQFISE